MAPISADIGHHTRPEPVPVESRDALLQSVVNALHMGHGKRPDLLCSTQGNSGLPEQADPAVPSVTSSKNENHRACISYTVSSCGVPETEKVTHDEPFRNNQPVDHQPRFIPLITAFPASIPSDIQTADSHFRTQPQLASSPRSAVTGALPARQHECHWNCAHIR